MKTSSAYLKIQKYVSRQRLSFFRFIFILRRCCQMPCILETATTDKRVGLLYNWRIQRHYQLCSLHFTNESSEFPLTVIARHCSREGAISKPRLLVCKKRRTDRKLCCNCWMCSCLFTQRPIKSTLRCVFLYNCVQNACYMAVSVSVFV